MTLMKGLDADEGPSRKFLKGLNALKMLHIQHLRELYSCPKPVTRMLAKSAYWTKISNKL